MGKVATDKSELIAAIPLACADERAAVEFMEKQRWDGKPICPRCGNENVYAMTDRKTGERQANYRWRCRDCGQAKRNAQFTVRVGTVLEDSPIPLRHWTYAFWRASTSKKGASALEIKRHTGLSYKSALFLMNRIRFAMADEGTDQLKGPVEIDEAFLQGAPRKIPRTNKSIRALPKPILAMVEREGRVRVHPIADVSFKNVTAMIHKQIAVDSTVFTDSALKFRSIIGLHFKEHGVINHSIREYSRKDPKGGPDIGTNTVESFFALVKRSIHGTYHSVSQEHLHRYLAERAFTYNYRGLEDGERTVQAIKGGIGRRLTYKESVGA